jgi:hypothetical protein
LTAEGLSDLQAALPRAPPPEHQTVQNLAIWYTTLGRLLDSPQHQNGLFGRLFGGAHLAESAVQTMTKALCGLETTMDRLWYALEFDMMALGLSGNWSKVEAHFSQERCM